MVVITSSKLIDTVTLVKSSTCTGFLPSFTKAGGGSNTTFPALPVIVGISNFGTSSISIISSLTILDIFVSNFGTVISFSK